MPAYTTPHRRDGSVKKYIDLYQLSFYAILDISKKRVINASGRSSKLNTSKQ
jgi:hypothetical protein